MIQNLLNSVVKPLIRRVGSTAAGALVVWGANAELASQVEVGLTALCLIGIDLWLSNLDKKGK
jgi:hypothetical protein